ncbi:hypothetical protein P5673_025204 [Acropora cervicornis]|uniref:Uncharacterized protein n=1 Tax=Acropora cervicornis TaxID=6130 RepID=A0AAD9Q2A3_ACRCE|nr:hypothetical protein P5673_025204 [Acropora cervicornis]
MIREAPADLQPITAASPTAPSPQTAVVEPGSTCQENNATNKKHTLLVIGTDSSFTAAGLRSEREGREVDRVIPHPNNMCGALSENYSFRDGDIANGATGSCVSFDTIAIREGEIYRFPAFTTSFSLR